MSSPPHNERFRLASAVGFLLLGGAVSLYGPAVPLFRERYGVATSVAGLALAVHSVASIVGVLVWGAMDDRGAVRPALLTGAGSVAVGAVTVALAPTFGVVLAGVTAIGLGFGLVNTGINALYSRDRTVGAAGRMNVLHAMFGVGAVGFPLLLSFAGLAVSFVAVAVLMGSALPALREAVDPGVLEPSDDSAAARRSARLVLVGFLTVFTLYIGTELGVGNWMAAHLTDQDWSPQAAARWTAAYFLAFTIGRLLVARFAADVHPARVVITALLLGAVAAFAASVDGLTPFAYVAVGLAVAPVFPTTMVWLSRRLPEHRHAPAAGMLAGSFGAAVLPAAIGGAVGVGGTEVVPFAVAAVALAGAAAATAVRRSALRAEVASTA